MRPSRHRMHQIVGTTHTGQRPVERRLVEAITGDNFSGRLDWRNLLGLPGQATNGVAAFFKAAKKAAADVSRGASEQNAHVILSSRPVCRQNDRVDHCMTPLLAVYRFHYGCE